MSVIVHLVGEGDAWPKLSVCGAALCGRGRARCTTRRNGSDCRACAAAVLPGAFGGTSADPDSIDVSLARNAVDHYTRPARRAAEHHQGLKENPPTMSITFLSDAPCGRHVRMEACLCAQMCPDFMQATADELRVHASPTCTRCGGTGLEKIIESDGPTMNLNSANAAALLEMLGLQVRPHGVLTIPEARRGVIRARNRKDLSRWCRQAVDGPRAFSPAFTEHDLVERLDRFADLVEQAAVRGARSVVWG